VPPGVAFENSIAIYAFLCVAYDSVSNWGLFGCKTLTCDFCEIKHFFIIGLLLAFRGLKSYKESEDYHRL
jgi:hypothetical protein